MMMPQPDGPTKTKNSPCSTSKLMPPSATGFTYVDRAARGFLHLTRS